MKTFVSGAKSSEAAPRLDLIPLASLLRQAARMEMGAASHGERNFEKGAGDPAFIRDRKNHLLLHCLKYVAGDMSDDHLGAILANAGMCARLEELSEERLHASDKSYDEKRRDAQPCLGGCGMICQNHTTCRNCLRQRSVTAI